MVVGAARLFWILGAMQDKECAPGGGAYLLHFADVDEVGVDVDPGGAAKDNGQQQDHGGGIAQMVASSEITIKAAPITTNTMPPMRWVRFQLCSLFSAQGVLQPNI